MTVTFGIRVIPVPGLVIFIPITSPKLLTTGTPFGTPSGLPPLYPVKYTFGNAGRSVLFALEQFKVPLCTVPSPAIILVLSKVLKNESLPNNPTSKSLSKLPNTSTRFKKVSIVLSGVSPSFVVYSPIPRKHERFPSQN